MLIFLSEEKSWISKMDTANFVKLLGGHHYSNATDVSGWYNIFSRFRTSQKKIGLTFLGLDGRLLLEEMALDIWCCLI